MVIDLRKYIPRSLKNYNIGFPKPESNESICDFLNSYGVDSENCFVFKDLNSFISAFSQSSLRFPNIYFFDSKGRLLKKTDTFISTELVNQAFIDNLYNLSTSKDCLIYDLDNFVKEKNVSSKLSEGAITVIVTWAIYAGDLNMDFGFKWMSLLESAYQKGFKINGYLFNMDPQENWDYSI